MMNTDKAYIMGLVIGGGCFSSDNKTFYIKLPYKQWGIVEKNPERAGVIAKDILRTVKPLMRLEYGLDITYSAGRDWRIDCIGDITPLIEDLQSVNIEPTAELHKTADISILVSTFSDNNMRKRFIAGVADTIGSMAPSQRRFSDNTQIISFEISGFNYKFVCQLCNLLYTVGCMPDQILWQHPNMQAGNDSYYTQWKKGNKLRVTLDAFSTFGSLAFKSKSIASKENLSKEKSAEKKPAEKCEDKKLSVSGVVAVHIDENHKGIPEDIRGGHYIHHKQICAALNCCHAPFKEVDRLLLCAENYTSPFTVLHKDNLEKINKIINDDPVLKNRNYAKAEILVSDIIAAVDRKFQTVTFDNGKMQLHLSKKKGYPLSVVLDATAYIIASKTGNLNGKRYRGNREEVISNALTSDPAFSVTVEIPDLLTPLIITDGKVAAMVGPLNADVYKNLISYSDDNAYKMQVRKITEDDLR